MTYGGDLRNSLVGYRRDSYLHSHSDGRHRVHLPLNPGPDLVGLLGKLPSKGLVVLLLFQLVLQGLVSLRHQVLQLVPLRLNVVSCQVGVRVDCGARNIVLFGEVLTVVDKCDD